MKTTRLDGAVDSAVDSVRALARARAVRTLDRDRAFDRARALADTLESVIVRARALAHTYDRAHDRALADALASVLARACDLARDLACDLARDLAHDLENVDRARACDWFNINCFTAPAKNTQGNSGFNILRGPAFANWDLTLGKSWNFSEVRRLQFRTDFLNAFNQTQFGLPNAQVDVAGAGTITGVASNTAPRRIQFGLKLYF